MSLLGTFSEPPSSTSTEPHLIFLSTDLVYKGGTTDEDPSTFHHLDCLRLISE